MNPNTYSGRTLAYLGDAVWSVIVRKWLIENGETKGKPLQKRTVKYVNAKAQAYFYETLHEEGFWTDHEEEIFRRGRNDHNGSVPHSTDPRTYRKSTGFEAVIGILELEGQQDRILEIWNRVRTLEEAE